MSADTVRKLYITLRRSFAGTRETQVRTLQSLGFKYREQTVVQDNTESVRGAILKVAHNRPVLIPSSNMGMDAYRHGTHSHALIWIKSQGCAHVIRYAIWSLWRQIRPLRPARQLRQQRMPCGLPFESYTRP